MEIEGLERKIADNPYNYTEEQQQEKLIALKTMKDIYPDVNPYYAEIIYDLCKNSSQEDIDKMKERIDTIPPKQEDLTKNNILI